MTVTINGTTGVAGVDGTAATPAIQGNDTNTGIFFPAADTIAFAEGGAEVARFDSSGNLGLGTSSPVGKLDINTAGNSEVRIGNKTDFTQNINVYYRTTGLVAQTAGADGIFTWGVNGGAERMRIDSSGNLLVGTTALNPSANGLSYDQGNGIVRTGHASGTASGTAYSVFVFNGGAIGTITQNGTTAVAYNTSSDYRLKENIAPMTGALAKVSALKPCTYTWKADGSDGQGFIAHELQEICPDAVTGEKDAINEDGSIKAQGIDTSFLVATLTAAIQEQQAIITDLKARIETLENK